MNNPGIDPEMWNQLQKKWADLEAKGHKLKIDFKLVADPNDANKILVIDVVQHMDGELITQTVERIAGEAYTTLGISSLSMESLVQVCKDMMKQLHHLANQRDVTLIMLMSPTSGTSGETRAYLEKPDIDRRSIVTNYQHYYVLNALRKRMIELLGEDWAQVRATYHVGELDFYFEY